MDKYDFIAIGDTATDAFIKLKIARIETKGNDMEITMPFATKIPFEDSVVIPAVGNAANAAVAASRLGLRTALVATVGSDKEGQEDIEALQGERVSTDFITIEEGKRSNYHYVLLYGGERTILIKHEQYSYKLPELGGPRFIYLSSIAQNSLPYHVEIANYLKAHPETKLAFQPGTFQMELGTEALKELYANTEIFFSNVEEAELILKDKLSAQDRKEQVKYLLEKMHKLGPKNVVITDGPKGAYAYDGSQYYFMPPYPDPAAPLDRTGAGDSFSSTVVAALALDLPLKDALEWGPVNSMSVVQYIGAREGLLRPDEIKQYLADRPDFYHAETI